jgi:hypothetical protein
MADPVEASRPLMPTRPLMLVFASAFGFSTAFVGTSPRSRV